MEDPYSILKIKLDASNAEIKNAYRALAKKYHPDVSKETDAKEHFMKISEAYQIITEKPYEYQFEYAYSATNTYKKQEFERKENAKKYAEMNYESFKRNNNAFRKAWYFGPVKYGVYFFIIFSYFLALTMFLAPLLAWLITKSLGSTFFMFFVTLFSSHTYQYVKILQKEVKPYFSNY